MTKDDPRLLPIVRGRFKASVVTRISFARRLLRGRLALRVWYGRPGKPKAKGELARPKATKRAVARLNEWATILALLRGQQTENQGSRDLPDSEDEDSDGS